ncbi:MAG: hypothetical protein QM689_07060 [Oscillospiraceae bacterium]
MVVIDGSVNYITKIFFEQYDGSVFKLDEDAINKVGIFKADQSLLSGISMFRVKNAECESKKGDYVLQVSAKVEKNQCVLSVKDDANGKIYQYDNGSGNETKVKIAGNDFPQWMVGKTSYFLMTFSNLILKGDVIKEVRWRVTDMETGKTLYISEPQDDMEVRMPVKSNSLAVASFRSVLTDGKMTEFDAEALEKYTAKKLINLAIKQFKSGKLSSLDICGNETETEMYVLSITMADGKFSLGVINEYDESIYYYDNGSNDENFTELSGETYPNYMISEASEVFKTAVEDFIKTGKPSKRLIWRVQKG